LIVSHRISRREEKYGESISILNSQNLSTRERNIHQTYDAVADNVGHKSFEINHKECLPGIHVNDDDDNNNDEDQDHIILNEEIDTWSIHSEIELFDLEHEEEENIAGITTVMDMNILSFNIEHNEDICPLCQSKNKNSSPVT
jgi:hypothetical protein